MSSTAQYPPRIRRMLDASTGSCVAVCDVNRFWPETAVLVGSGCVGFEPYRAKVASCGQVHVGVQGGGQAAQEGDGGLGTWLGRAVQTVEASLSCPS